MSKKFTSCFNEKESPAPRPGKKSGESKKFSHGTTIGLSGGRRRGKQGDLGRGEEEKRAGAPPKAGKKKRGKVRCPPGLTRNFSREEKNLSRDEKGERHETRQKTSSGTTAK